MVILAREFKMTKYKILRQKLMTKINQKREEEEEEEIED